MDSRLLPGCQAQVGSSLSIGTRKGKGLQASFCSAFPSSCLLQPYPSFLINLGWKLYCGFFPFKWLHCSCLNTCKPPPSPRVPIYSNYLITSIFSFSHLLIRAELTPSEAKRFCAHSCHPGMTGAPPQTCQEHKAHASKLPAVQVQKMTSAYPSLYAGHTFLRF